MKLQQPPTTWEGANSGSTSWEIRGESADADASCLDQEASFFVLPRESCRASCRPDQLKEFQ
jgi:hypothetical protein